MSSINKIKTNDVTYDVEDTSKQGLLIPGDNITIENNVISAQNSYVLPVAGENTLGGVKVGDNLSIDVLGKLSSKNFNIMLKNVVGNIPAIVQPGDKYYKPSTNKIYTYIANAWDEGVEPSLGVNYINLDDNRIYLYNGTTLKLPVDPYTLPVASSVQLGGVMVGSNLSITGTGVLNAIDTTYTAGDNITISSNNVISAPDSVGQFDSMPTASEDYLNKVVQFVGTTDSTYTNGYFYKCVSDGAAEPVYSWEALSVQPEADQAHITIIDKRGDTTAVVLEKLKTYYANYLENKEYALYIDSPTSISVGMRCTFVPDPTFGISATKLCLSSLVNPSYRYGGSSTTQNYGVKYSYCQIVVLTINISDGVPTSYTIGTPSIGSVVGYLPYNTTSLLGMDNTTAWSPSGDYNPATKKYVDDNILKRSTLPVASSSNVGTIYQYTGTTNQNYTNGYFYQSVSNGASPATYSWERIDVQPQSSSDPGIPTYSVFDNGNSYTHFKIDQKPAITNILNYALSHNGNLPNAYFGSSCGSAFLVSIAFTENTTNVAANLYYRGIVKRYNSDMGDGLSSLYSSLYFTVYLDPTEYANKELTTVYYSSSLPASETIECEWYYNNTMSGKVVQSGTTFLLPREAVNKLTYSSNIPSGTDNVYIYTGEVPNQQNYKYGHIYHCVNNPTLGRNEMVELKQATDSCEILMYDGTTSSDSASTVNKYYTNIKNGIPTVLLLVTDQYPYGSGSATSATGKMIIPMSLDTTSSWSSTYRACLIGTAVSYDATGVYHAKQVLRFQDDTVTGLYTLQWKAPDGGSSGMSLTEWFQRSGLSEYSSSSTYNVGDFVYYSGQIYVCDTAIATAESWDSTKWTQITYLDYLNRVLVGNALGGSY